MLLVIDIIIHYQKYLCVATGCTTCWMITKTMCGSKIYSTIITYSNTFWILLNIATWPVLKWDRLPSAHVILITYISTFFNNTKEVKFQPYFWSGQFLVWPSDFDLAAWLLALSSDAGSRVLWKEIHVKITKKDSTITRLKLELHINLNLTYDHKYNTRNPIQIPKGIELWAREMPAAEARSQGR
jgi:hypothetical protein